MKTVEEALSEERKNIKFSVTKLSQFLYGKQFYAELKRTLDELPEIHQDLNIFNKERQYLIKQTYKDFPTIYNLRQTQLSPQDAIYMVLAMNHQMPGSVHYGMFIKCIEVMGTLEQQKEYLQKCRNYDIIGCYAQTQLGHGSDVQSLQTTATFDQENDQFIINTPSISAAKYWPGDLGLFCTHAMVYAQLIIKGKKHGIHAFIVPIRDQERNALPGIQVGDIGPKIGYHAKDNGYLLMKNIRISRKSMLRRFISVSKDGQLKIKGDPKISYAAMMNIRMFISCAYPRIYGSGITIATRYSMFRRQFKNQAKQQIKVIDYQLQQEKIIQRVAQYYAITAAGSNIREICHLNTVAVQQKQNFDYLAQTHICLCIGKAFFSEVVYSGLEVCRKACGGHGFSHYSGFPWMINEYAAKNTLEGENTILYLQIARYLLKSYKNFMVKKKPISNSVKYIESYDYLISKKCEINDPQKWSLEQLRILLAQSVLHLIAVVTEKMMSKPEQMPASQLLNKQLGIRLQNMGIMHSAYYTYNALHQQILKEKDQQIKQLMTQLGLLLGSNLILNYPVGLIEGEYLNRDQIQSLVILKENLLRKLRPNLIGLVDAFGIPDKFIRSALISGNPYENYLKLARENELNHQRLESVDYVLRVKDYIKNPNPKL